jgi:hypothetical protein
VSTAVVGHNIEATRPEALDDAGGTGAVVRNSVKIHKHASPVTRRVTPPAFENHARTGKRRVITGLRRAHNHAVTGRMEQTSCPQRGQLSCRHATAYCQENDNGEKRQTPSMSLH